LALGVNRTSAYASELGYQCQANKQLVNNTQQYSSIVVYIHSFGHSFIHSFFHSFGHWLFRHSFIWSI